MASPIFSATPRHQQLGLAAIRVITGVVFLAHGWQKVFVYGIAGVQGAFTQMGAPLPMITGPLIGGLELLGGAALIIGLLSRLVALGLVVDMLGAIALVHFKNGFFMPKGYEFVLMLLAGSLAVFLGGPGAPAVDNVIAGRSNDIDR